jgi:4-hydroxy-2-oxoheptanedioate aldolase
VPGIDLVLEGAVDLSQSYGVPGQMHHPEVRAAVETIARQCTAHGIPFCAVPRTPEQMHAWRSRQVRAYLLGDDRGVSFRALKAYLAAMRAE